MSRAGVVLNSGRAFLSVSVVLLLSSMFFPPSVCGAEEVFDPYARNLVFVEGDAEKTVPVDMFELTFAFDMQKGTFEEAGQASEALIGRISSSIAKMGLKDVEIIKGWDILKQAKISIGSSGSRISNTLTVRVSGIPEGELHGLITGVIDRALAADREVYLESISTGVTQRVEREVKKELMASALEALKANAEKAAETQGSSVRSAKRIFVSDDAGVLRRAVMSDASLGEYAARAMNRVVSIQKGFEVRSQVPSHMVFSSRVSGIYEIE